MKIFKISLFSITTILLMSVTSCQKDKYPELGEGLYAEFVTTKGTMVAKLAYDKTPVTVANFVALAEGTHSMVTDSLKGKPFYNGIIFHRVINKFMIQGGDPTGTGSGSPGYKFADEFDTSLRHDKPGILAMANSGPATNSSQFYITETPTPNLDGLDGQGNFKNCGAPRVSCHTVFGELVKGLEILDSISNVKVAPGSNKPIDSVIINQLNIIRQGYEARNFDALKTWETELPLLEEKNKKKIEDAKKKAEEEKKLKDETNKRMGVENLKRINDLKAKAKTLSSGLKMYTITNGTGDKPKQGNKVMVNYEGYLAADGTLFDSNLKSIEEKYFGKANPLKEQYDRYQSTPMEINPDARLIAGFKEALTLMKVGDKSYFFIPSHLAYGERGAPPVIPANADIVFILEILDIVKP